MSETLDPLSDRACRMTHAYKTGIELRETLRDGACLRAAVSEVTIYMEHLEDSYPEWHPAPDSFRGMVRLFVYREITGDNYRTLETYQELAEPFGLDHVPDESVLSRTWRNRFDDGVREYVTVAAHFVVKEIHDHGPAVTAVRPKEEVTNSKPELADDDEQDESGGVEFSDEQIRRTTRLARDHGFDGFDSGRAKNASYEDVQFFELQTFMGMVGCGTAQGAARFQFRRGEEYGPHGDTHLRAVKQFEPEALIEGFDQASDRLLSAIASEVSFRRPVTAAIDITTIPYYGDVEGMSMVSGMQGEEERAFKFATLSIVGENIPLVLSVEPIRESSAWDRNPPNQIHRVVRRLVQRAKEHVPVETVLCDREFDSKRVYQTLSNLGVNYLIPTRINNTEREVIETMDADGQGVAVESASVHLESGSHSMQFLYMPSTSGEGTTVFATNLRVGPEEAESFCRRYSRRWQIENEYKSIKSDFLAKTSSKDYRVRLFYFVFAVLLYNIWRLTDFLLKAGVDGEMDYAPVLAAGECVEIVVSALIPPD
ncbi:transposase [Natrialba taiwanensis]|uniref:Putative transposase (TCE33) n=1 Tax=Natrialba taiwanensis DSM 12281 TaxID=1230458 RepID=M0A5W5_9EURY|nr:transposase [Natrialba taiwanensis]ELY93736.1 putative transposase (TCE33) [Natrialba taiwanensis DSM 12281]